MSTATYLSFGPSSLRRSGKDTRPKIVGLCFTLRSELKMGIFISTGPFFTSKVVTVL